MMTMNIKLLRKIMYIHMKKTMIVNHSIIIEKMNIMKKKIQKKTIKAMLISITQFTLKNLII
jgi:hypothetical protein